MSVTLAPNNPADIADKATVSCAGAQLSPMYRMPTVFGPASGPRNLPADKQRYRYQHRRSVWTVDALTDVEAVAACLPAGCSLAGEPVMRVTVTQLTELAWLAGRGYNIVTVQFPNIVFQGSAERIVGMFNAVLWESLCDPIITGREEIAYPKIYAEIPNPTLVGNAYSCTASWLGFRFFDMRVTDLVDAPETKDAAPAILTHKYVPKTGQWGEADADYMTVSGPDPGQPPVSVHSFRKGSGSFAFHRARWEDMPTQYPIVSALAAMPIKKFLGASHRVTSQGETDSVGGGQGIGQRIVR